MIFYFSATGNTRYVADSIGKSIGDKACFIPSVDSRSIRLDGDSLGFSFPIYSWGVPPIVLNFINRLPDYFIKEVIIRKIPVWLVCTCGDETGEAIKMFEKALARRGLELSGAWSVIMPNTYVLLPGFDVDSIEVEKAKLQEAITRINEIGELIEKRTWRRDIHKGSFPLLRTSLFFPLFKKWGIDTKKWKHTEACVKCGKCVAACPVRNISMSGHGPEWGSECLSCLACYHVCPYHAVEYGNITKNKGQYTCPL